MNISTQKLNSRLKSLLILALCALCILQYAAYGRSENPKPGAYDFMISETTPDGTAVIPMWEAQMPDKDQSNAVGFPVLKDARHFDVWKPAHSREGTYNHYSCLVFHDGRFYAMWGNHPYGENCSGQRVLFSSSTDGRSWSKPAELFPPTGPFLTKGGKGLYLTPDRWAITDGKLYAVTYVHGSEAGPYPIVREVADEGARLGETILLRELPHDVELPGFFSSPVTDPALGVKLRQWYEANGTISWWAHSDNKSMISWWAQDGKGISPRAIDGARLIEMFSFRSDKGVVVAFARDYSTHIRTFDRKSSNRLYVSVMNDNNEWCAMRPTNIPDSHSRAQALRLPDGRVLLAGNQIAYQFDKGIYLVRDPLTLAVSPDGESFTKVFALRSAGKTPLKRRVSGITGSGPAGYGYPSMTLHEGRLYVLYSVNKEDMAITIIPLASLQ